METTYKTGTIGLPSVLFSIYVVLDLLNFVVTGSGLGSLLKLISVPIGGLSLVWLFAGNTRIRMNSIHFLLALYFLYMVASQLISCTAETRRLLFGYGQVILLFFVLTARVFNKREYELIRYSFLAVGLLTAVLMMFSSESTVEDRAVLYIFGNYTDPNQICMYMVVGVILSMERIVNKTKNLPLYFGFILLLMYQTLQTGSRGGLMAVSVSAIAYVFVASKSTKQRILTLVVAASVFCIVYFIIFPMLPGNLRERYTVQNVIEGRGTGRFGIWEVLMASVLEKPKYLFFGKGIMSTGRVLAQSGIENSVAHNTFIQVLHDTGVIGIVFFFGAILCAMVRSFRNHKEITFIIFGLLILSFSITYDTTAKTFWNVLMLAALTCGEDKNTFKALKKGSEVNGR